MTRRRWSISAGVLILAALISSVAFIHATDALIFLALVAAIVAGINAVARIARRH